MLSNFYLPQVLLIGAAFLLGSCGQQNGMLNLGSGNLQKQVNVVDNEGGACSSCQSLSIVFKIDQNRGGRLCVAVFDSQAEYDGSADENYQPLTVYEDCIAAEVGELTLNLPGQKEYGIVEFHDANQNDKLDKLPPLQIPKEGFGFSNNPPLRAGRPSWDEIKFHLGDQDLTLEIKNHYLF